MLIDGRKIKGIRLQKNLSRAELSRKSGVPLRTLEDWESGIRNPKNVSQVNAVCNVLDCHISQLYNDEFVTYKSHALSLIEDGNIATEDAHLMHILNEALHIIPVEEFTVALEKLLKQYR